MPDTVTPTPTAAAASPSAVAGNGSPHTPGGAAPAGRVVLSVQDVRKVYRSGPEPVEALRGVSLDVCEGEFVAVMGPSGSGKSTLLNLLGALETVDGGRIVIDGDDLSAMGDHALSLFRRRKLGYIFQQLNLLPTLTAAENVTLPLLIDGRRPGDVTADALRALELVGLAGRAGHRPEMLSGGEQQRVAIARCLLTAPAVILADEPTGNLDSTNGDRVLGLLRAVTRGEGLPGLGGASVRPVTGGAGTATGAGAAGTATAPSRRHTVVMVTHEPRAAARTDRVLFLRDGRLVGEQKLDGTADAAFVADCRQRIEDAPRA